MYIYILYFSRSANNVLDTMGMTQQVTAKHSALLNQRCSSNVIYTIHGFTAGAFTPPSGEQGRLRRTYSQCGHALAGGFYCLFAFGILCSLSKVPL